MFLSAIALALLVGALAGGGLPRLAELRLRWIWLLGLALGLRIVAVLGPGWGLTNLPFGGMFAGTYLLIFAWLWGNWRVPGLQVAAVGIGLNTLAVLFNAGRMPVWTGALDASGLTGTDLGSDPFHFLMGGTSVADFVRRGGIFGDVVPIPLPVIRDVVSIGDLLLAMGIFWAIVSSMTRPEAPVRPGVALGMSPPRPTAGGEFQAGVAYAGAFATPAQAGSGPMVAPSPMLATQTAVAVPRAGAIAAPRSQSPYLRLARNANFALFWVGQLISLFGDRIHQTALAVLVAARGNPLEVGIVFAMTAVPNVILGPLAGALADRWDRRLTMIGCDVVRSGLVLLVPLAAQLNIGLVYAIAFAVASVSIVFRPAKNAIVPLIVHDDELVTANSATTVTETFADLLGYPAAGLLVAALGPALIAIAFVVDSASYVVSALLLWSMKMARSERVTAPFSLGAIWGEMVDGWQFLRRQTELFANTLVSAFAQVAVGAEIVCSVLYAKDVLDQSRIAYPENYTLLMAAIGVGSIVGGLVIGMIADRLPKGPLSIAGFVSFGLVMAATFVVRDAFMAIVVFFLIGATNMVFLIPNITLFQERTPQRLMARVVSTRQAIVFGVMAASMALAGWATALPGFGPQAVLAVGGVLCAVAGLGGLLVPAMRNAR